MQKITTTVYIPVNDEKTVYLLFKWPDSGGKFIFAEDLKYHGYLQKKEDQVVMSKVDFENFISNAITDGVDSYIKKEQYPSDKFIDTYINNLLNN